MPNQLQYSRSPYLLQHANNPVDWMPWGPEALQKAQQENKLLIISVGYSACHWCHVMEHESFEDTEVAALMNNFFVPVKVDREERPDVDQVYMNAAMLINGSGGWPLNAIALPDGRPIYAGTYFPKQNWMQVLAYFADLYRKDPGKMTGQAERLTQGIRQLDFLPKSDEHIRPDARLLDITWHHWRPKTDQEYGGRSGAPKFMMPNNYEFLLRYAYTSGDESARQHTETTLEKMALSGLYDQLAGGFTRYSTDEQWHIPHFEKMLYDNAQLLSVYAQAYRAYGQPLYKDILYHTTEWLSNEMVAPDGGYYAALDADSEGEEGKFYVWTWDELASVLDPDDLKIFAAYYHCTWQGNWEHGLNHLHATETTEVFAQRKNLDPEALKQLLLNSRTKLLSLRNQRLRPGLDDKRITGWNALLISGFVQSYWATEDVLFLEKAKQLAAFFTDTLLKDDGSLWHTYNRGSAYLDAYLSDYAPAITGFIQLYQATFDESYLLQAYQWAEYCIDHFYDEKSGLFYLTSDHAEGLVSRPMQLSDNVISSSNSILARALWQLGHYFDKPVLKEMSAFMLQVVLKDLLKNGPFYAEWATLLWEQVYPFHEVVLTADHADRQLLTLYRKYWPTVLPVGSILADSQIPLLESKTKPYIYVCRNQTCQAPVSDIHEVVKLIGEG